MNRCACGSSAGSSASTSRCGIPVRAARETGDGDALRLAGDPLDRLELAGRRGREAGLDHVDVEADELAGDLDLLGRRSDPRRVPAPRRAASCRRRGCRRRHPAPVVRRVRILAWRSCPCSRRRGRRCRVGGGLGLRRHRPRPGSGTPSASAAAADLLDLVVAIGLAHPVELGPPVLVLLDPARGEGARLDVGQDVLHGRLDAFRDPRARTRSRRTRPCR